MAVPPEHLIYLRQKGYTPSCTDAFSEEEAAVLVRYGHWMEALASGRIAPTTPQQSHFLQVAQGEAEPETPFERVWRKLCSQQSIPDPFRPLVGYHQADWPTEAPGNHEEPWTKLEQLAEAKRYVEEIRGHMEAKREEVLRAIQPKLEAIDAEYAQQLEEGSQAVAELESEVKAEVLKLGKSVRVECVQAIFYRGRVTWDSKGLTQYAHRNPEVEQFRKVSAPSVAIRYKKS